MPMSKPQLTPILLGACCLLAGVYGAVHDQISYTVSPDYFHALKFDQFRTPTSLQNGWGASLVGVQATWWMGVIIGIPLLLLARTLPTARDYASRTLLAFAVVLGTAFLVSLGGLIYALWLPSAQLPNFVFPSGVVDRAAFARVGLLHEFSYLGGFLGIITGSIYLIVEKWRLGKRSAKD